MERDVILTIFSTSSSAPAQQWVQEYFKDPAPIVLICPGGGGIEFRSHISRWAKTGDLFTAALKELNPTQAKDTTIRNRGLVSFSAGWGGADEFFNHENELNRLSAYLLLDGMHSENIDNWVKFATRAASLQALMVMAHTSIKPPFVSSTTTNTRIFQAAKANVEKDPTLPLTETSLPDYILHAQLPPEGIHISLPGAHDANGKETLKPVSKTWTKDPLMFSESIGDLYRLQYEGNDRPDHVFVAWHIQKRLYQFLAEYWA